MAIRAPLRKPQPVEDEFDDLDADLDVEPEPVKRVGKAPVRRVVDEEEPEDEPEDEEPPRPLRRAATAPVRRPTRQEPVEDEEPAPKAARRPTWFSEDPAKFEESSARGDRYKFQQDETVTLMFLKETPFIFNIHFMGKGKGNKSQTCLVMDCPLCEVPEIQKPQQRGAYWVGIYNSEGVMEPFLVVEGKRFGAKFVFHKKKRGTLLGVVFEVTKTGKDTDTDWNFDLVEKNHPLSKEERAFIGQAPNMLAMFAPADKAALREIARQFE